MKVSKYEFIRSPFVTREDTRALKGYAILIMLFLHLFNNKELDCTLEVWFYIKDIPLCYWRECNLNSVWFLFLLNHNKYNFFFLDLQMLLKVVFGCVQGRRRMSRLYTLAHIRELPFLCV